MTSGSERPLRLGTRGSDLALTQARGIAARLAGTPLLVHEQNRIPGLTNKVLAEGLTVIEGVVAPVLQA